jgi:hypothetical protein
MQKQERFCGPNKIIEGRRVEKHGNPKQRNKTPICVWSSSSPKFVSYLSNFQKIIIITKD